MLEEHGPDGRPRSVCLEVDDEGGDARGGGPKGGSSAVAYEKGRILKLEKRDGGSKDSEVKTTGPQRPQRSSKRTSAAVEQAKGTREREEDKKVKEPS